MTKINIKEFKPLVRVLDAVRASFAKRHTTSAVFVSIEAGHSRWSLAVEGRGVVYSFDAGALNPEGTRAAGWLDAGSIGALKKQSDDFIITLENGSGAALGSGRNCAIQSKILAAEAIDTPAAASTLETVCAFEAESFLEAYKLVAPCIGPDNGLGCSEVFVDVTPESGVRLVATDGKRLAYATVHGAYVPVAGGAASDLALPKWSASLPADLLGALVKSFRPGDTAQLCAGPGSVEFSTRSVSFVLPTVDRTFPSYRLFVGRTQSWVLDLDSYNVAKVLKDILDVAKIEYVSLACNAEKSEILVGYKQVFADDVVWVPLDGDIRSAGNADSPNVSSDIKLSPRYLLDALPARPGKFTLGWTDASGPLSVTHTPGAEYVFMPFAK